MSDCLFCGIVAKTIPAEIVYETDKVLAFRDRFPKAPVHILVIPKEHLPSLMQIEGRHAELLGDIHEAIRAVVKKEKADVTGFRVVVNTGGDSGQSVGHLHYHVMAGRKLAWPPG